MTKVEFDSWVEYYMLAPFDDGSRYHRPAAVIAASMGSGDVAAMMRHVSPVVGIAEDAAKSKYSEADLRTFAAFGMKPPQGN